MKRLILLLSIITVLFAEADAQQRPMYTQFMFNKLAYNPAYPGSQSARVTALYRKQWMGFEGAPETMTASFTTPLLNNKAGLGVNLNHQEIGISKISTGEVSLMPWKMKLYYGELRFGFQFSLSRLTQNWNDPRIVRPQPGVHDNDIPDEVRSKVNANGGVGVYYSAPGWYIGFAVPRILEQNIDVSEEGGILSKEVKYYNLMAGYDFQLADGFVLTPQALFQASPNAPFSAELNLSALVRSRFYGGLTFRFGGESKSLGESLAALVGMQATEDLFFCLSYDMTLTRIRQYSSGSVEAVVRYTFGQDVDVSGVENVNPWE